jgi:hypothetical protein
MSEIHRLTPTSPQLWRSVEVLGNYWLKALTGTELLTMVKDFQSQLMIANKSIYEDLAWQHRAYVASGIEALRYVDQLDNPLEDTRNVDINDWEEIDKAIQEQETLGDLLEPNKNLLQREQRSILQPIYEKIKGIEIAVKGTLAGHQFTLPLPFDYAQLMSIMTKNPIPGGKSFNEFIPNGNIAEFFDRWEWIGSDTDEGMYRIWVGSSSRHPFPPQQRLQEVKKPLELRAAPYRFP